MLARATARQCFRAATPRSIVNNTRGPVVSVRCSSASTQKRNYRFSYSAGLIARFLDEHDIKYQPHSTPVCKSLFLDHGLRAKFPAALDGKEYLVAMSIQTCPPVAGPAFAETALSFYDTVEGGEGPRAKERPLLNLFTCKEFGYIGDTVLRHRLPEDLYQHILSVKQGLDANLVQKLLQRSSSGARYESYDDDDDDDDAADDKSDDDKSDDESD